MKENVANQETVAVNPILSMLKDIKIIKAKNSDRPSIVSLLKTEKLPVDDLPEHLDDFIVITSGKTRVAGLIGLEKYGDHGLLRSLVIDKQFRNRQLAAKLVAELESRALQSGIQYLYLLTETAVDYFSRLGYIITTRDQVPDALSGSSEFKITCPKTAIVMKKKLQ